jgi:hypothetical protein
MAAKFRLPAAIVVALIAVEYAAAQAPPKPKPPAKPTLTTVDLPTTVVVRQENPVVAAPLVQLTTDPLPPSLHNAVALARPFGRYNKEIEGLVQFEATADGPLFVAVTWAFDGNLAAALKAEVWSERRFPIEGWLPLVRIALLQPDGVKRIPHVVYFRNCRQGDKFAIRTRRLTPPLVIAPAAGAAPLDVMQMLPDPTLPELQQRDFIGGKAYLLLQQERYADLEAWTNELLRTGAEFPSGQYQVRSVTKVFQTRSVSSPPENQRAALPRLDVWLKKYPQSNSARLATASVLIELANLLRRKGNEPDVVAESHRRALELLFEVEQADKTIPHMYLEYMLLARNERWDLDLTREYFQRAVDSGSWCPQAVGEFLQYELSRADLTDLPTTRRRLQGYVEQAVASTRAQYGDKMYAASVKDFDFYFPEEPFLHLGYEWPRLKESFEQLLVRYPNSKRIQRAYLKLAATAGDRETARRWFDRLGPYDADDDEGWDSAFEYTMNLHWAAEDFAVGDQRKLIDLSVRGESGLVQNRRGLFVLDRKGWIYRLDPERDEIERVGTTVYSPTICFASDPAGEVFAVGTWYGTACVVTSHWKFGYRRFQFDGTDHVRTIAVSDDKKRLACGMESGRVYLMTLGDDGVHVDDKQTLAVGTTAADFLGFTADGETLITYTEGKVQLWNAATGEPGHAWQVHAKKGWASALSHDRKTLAVTCNDKAVRLYEIPSGKLLTEVPGVAINAGSMAFSADGTRLAIGLGRVEGTTPREVIVVDLTTKSVLRTFKGHKGSVLGLAFLDGDRTLFSVANDRSARLWDVPAK